MHRDGIATIAEIKIWWIPQNCSNAVLNLSFSNIEKTPKELFEDFWIYLYICAKFRAAKVDDFGILFLDLKRDVEREKKN